MPWILFFCGLYLLNRREIRPFQAGNRRADSHSGAGKEKQRCRNCTHGNGSYDDD